MKRNIALMVLHLCEVFMFPHPKRQVFAIIQYEIHQ